MVIDFAERRSQKEVDLLKNLSVTLLIFVMLVAASCTSNDEPPPNPTELAAGFIVRNEDQLTQVFAEALVGQNSLLAELGVEVVSDSIRGSMNWNFDQPRAAWDDVWFIEATADVSLATDKYLVSASLPFDIEVDTAAQLVEVVPDYPALDVEVQISAEAIEEAKDKAKDVLKNIGN